MATKVKRSPFAECEGQLFIELKYAGMHPLCAYMDGLRLYSLGKRKRTYLEINTAIEWHENEIKMTGGQWKDDFLKVLREAKTKFETERTLHNEPPRS